MLLDDELPGLTYLKMLCEQIPELEVVKSFSNPIVFIDELQRLDFDLCILDIEMPEMNGLQVANLLRGKPVIFATAYKEYAADAFDVDAVDYLRKPINRERLQQAVKKVMSRVHGTPDKNKQFIQLNTHKGKALIYFDQLYYIKTSEIDSRDKIAKLSNGEELTLKNISFTELIALLPANDFCRINKKEIVAIKAVQVFFSSEVTLSVKDLTGKNMTLVLSETYKSEFLKKVNV